MFAKTLHPTIDQRTVTIITDQQKGSIEAMKEVLPLAVNFSVPIIGRRTSGYMSRVARENSHVIGIMSCSLGRAQWVLLKSRKQNVNVTCRPMR